MVMMMCDRLTHSNTRERRERESVCVCKRESVCVVYLGIVADVGVVTGKWEEQNSLSLHHILKRRKKQGSFHTSEFRVLTPGLNTW